MYEPYFGNSENPFSPLPDDRFLYLTNKYSQALTMLRCDLESQALITLITGDGGCGKAILLRNLVN